MPKTPQQEGRYHEGKAAKELNMWFGKIGSELEARAVRGSGNQAEREDGHTDPAKVGDLHIRTPRGVIADRVEVKARDPMKSEGEITVARMNRWRAGRRILMARHFLGQWLCSMPVEIWEWFLERNDPPRSMVAECEFTRGWSINEVLIIAGDYPQWEGLCPIGVKGDDVAIYMKPRTLAELLEQAHGEGDTDG